MGVILLSAVGLGVFPRESINPVRAAQAQAQQASRAAAAAAARAGGSSQPRTPQQPASVLRYLYIATDTSVMPRRTARGDGRSRAAKADPRPATLPRAPPSVAASQWLLVAGVVVLVAMFIGHGGSLSTALAWAANGVIGGGMPGSSWPVVERPTRLMMAAARGDATAVQQILRSRGGGGVGGHVNAQTPQGLSALHFALQGRMNQLQDERMVRELRGRHEDCIRKLVAAGANPMVGHLSAL
jgi:hypothetical protein